MAANTGTINLTLTVKDDGSISIDRFAKNAKGEIDALSKVVKSTLGGAFDTVKGIVGGVFNQIFSLKGLIATIGIGAIAKGAIDTASSFENMQISLDTLTGGKGKATLDELNNWALKMPVNTKNAIQAFTQMKAMGLDPTIKTMTTLVDTMGALGGSEDMMMGVARALGQIQTKGRVSMEELLQLAERGVPVFDILQKKLGLTQEQLGNIGNEGIAASTAINAILEGLGERFGGQSEKMQSIWSGMMSTLMDYWERFKLFVMEPGLFDWLKGKLDGVIKTLDAMMKSGELKKFANEIGDTIITWIFMIELYIRAILIDIQNWRTALDFVAEKAKGVLAIFEAIFKLTSWIMSAGQAIGNASGWAYIQGEKAINSIGQTSISGPGIDSGDSTASSEQSGGAAPQSIQQNVNLTVNGTARAAQDPAELARLVTRQMQTLSARGY